MDELDDDEERIEAVLVSDSLAVISISGDIDIARVDAIREAIVAAVGSGARELVLDLAAVDFIDSSGLAVLIEARGSSDSVMLRRPSPAVTRLLATTGLTGVLPVEP